MYRGPLARRRRWGVPLQWGRRTRLPQAVPGRPGPCWYRLTLPATRCLSAPTPTTTPITSSRLEPAGPQQPGKVSADDTGQDHGAGAYHIMRRNGVKCCAKTTFSLGFPLVWRIACNFKFCAMLSTPLPLESMMTLSDAIAALHRAGYRASPSQVVPGYVKVLDPVYTRTGNLEPRTTYETRSIHPADVAAFIIRRS